MTAKVEGAIFKSPDQDLLAITVECLRDGQGTENKPIVVRRLFNKLKHQVIVKTQRERHLKLALARWTANDLPR